MLLAFLVCSISLAHAEPDSTPSTNPGSAHPDEHEEASELDEPEPDELDAHDRIDAHRTSGIDSDVPVGDDDAPTWAHDMGGCDAHDTSGLDAPSWTHDMGGCDAHDTSGLDAPTWAHDTGDDAPTWAHDTGDNAPTWAHDTGDDAPTWRGSWLGRVDVSVVWRRALNETTNIRRDEVWLVGTWRL